MGSLHAGCRLRHGELQAWEPHRQGLQVSPGLGDEYRYAVLGGDVGKRCRELLRETARAHEMVVHAGSINRDQSAYVALHSTQSVGIASSAIPEGAELPQTAG